MSKAGRSWGWLWPGLDEEEWKTQTHTQNEREKERWRERENALYTKFMKNGINKQKIGFFTWKNI